MQAIMKRLKHDKRAVSNAIVVMLSLVLVVIIVANVVLWSYQMNQLDWEKMQEKIVLTNAEHVTRSPWFTSQSEYTVNVGIRLSGTYTDTWAADSGYETFREETTLISYNPSGYSLGGSTRYISGTTADLATDNGVYMTFRSHVSASSTTAKTDAFIAYRDSTTTLNTSKERTWTGDSVAWGSQTEMPDAGSPVRFTRVAYCPLEARSFEKIVVTCSDDGYLDAYVWNGTQWIVTNNIAQVWTTAPTGAQRPFGIAYETASGRALLVYDVVYADATKDLGYKIWTFGQGWSSEYYIDVTGVASTNPSMLFVNLASNPDATSNQIAMVIQDDTNADTFAGIWNSSSWGLFTTLSTAYTIVGKEATAIVYSTYYKKILVVSGNGANSMVWKLYAQGATDWTAGTAFDPDPDTGNDVCFGTLKPDPAGNSTHDYVMYCGVNDLTDLNAWAWNMAESTPGRYNIVNEVDDAIDSNAQRCLDFAWEPTGNKGLIVWGTTSGYIRYNTYSISAGWGTSWTTNVAMAGGIHPWVQLRTNPRSINGDVKILGAVLVGTVFDIGAIKWDGTTFTVIGTNTISSDTTVITYECFEMEFMNFGPPSEFTSEVEFTGTSNTESWTQLVWTIGSSFTTTGVNATFQLYNYNTSSYPTSGDGYITYNSSATPNTDERRNQTITANPTYFRGPAGEWKVKIVGVKDTNSPFELKVDWVEFKVASPTNYRLDVTGEFALDLSTYSLAYVQSIEVQIRYRANDSLENWYLKAYNWTKGEYSDVGFNSTTGDTPTIEFKYFAVNLTNAWQSYVQNGMIRIKFCDNDPDVNVTLVDIDFLGVRFVIDGVRFSLKNESPLTSHVVAIWIVNATMHARYDTNFFLNSGGKGNYFRTDISLPTNNFTIRVVTERGNIAVFGSD